MPNRTDHRFVKAHLVASPCGAHLLSPSIGMHDLGPAVSRVRKTSHLRPWTPLWQHSRYCGFRCMKRRDEILRSTHRWPCFRCDRGFSSGITLGYKWSVNIHIRCPYLRRRSISADDILRTWSNIFRLVTGCVGIRDILGYMADARCLCLHAGCGDLHGVAKFGHHISSFIGGQAKCAGRSLHGDKS